MCSTLKSQENIQKAYMEKETETEIKYFIKEKKRKREIYTKNGIVNTKNSERNFKTQITQKQEKIAHHKLALKSNNSNPRNVNIGPAKHSQKPAQPEPLTLVIRIASR
jgi:hypothetical protein